MLIENHHMVPILILIGGGHAAGKKTTAHLLRSQILEVVPATEVKLIDLHTYESSVPQEYLTLKLAAITVNTSPCADLRPSRFDFEAARTTIEAELATKGPKVVIVHGLYGLYDKALRDLSRMKVFITSDADTRLIRWIRRDVLDKSKNISLELVINAYLQGAKAEMSNFIFPTKEFADVILPRGADANAVKLMVDGVVPLLESGLDLPKNSLRPTESFQSEKFDGQKGDYYELN